MNTSKIIDSEIINDCLSYPSDKIIDDIIEFSFTNSFSECVLFLQEIKKDYGFSLSDIITEVFYKLVKILEDKDNVFKIEKTRIINIIKLLKDIQFNMISTTDETIQVSAFIGALKL
jgi:hypothetical protein